VVGELFALDGKVAVVTGASRGIGRFLASALAHAGAAVALLGRDARRWPLRRPRSRLRDTVPCTRRWMSATIRASTPPSTGFYDRCRGSMCSLTTEVGIAGAAPYGASKSGLAGLTRTLATEWAARGIRVNGIGPGYFRTALTEPFYQDEQWQRAMLEKIPQRRFGRLDDLGGAAVFLCSDAAAYITGQILYIDGGYLAAL
jgi:gluconate 5-dehydrogenase